MTPSPSALRIPSLLEAAMSFAVLMVMWVSAMVVFSQAYTARAYRITDQHCRTVQEALVTHLLAFGYLPAPHISTPRSINPIASARVLMGNVPARLLGIAPEMAQDGWGRPLHYAVQSSATFVQSDLQRERSALRVRMLDSDMPAEPVVAVLASDGPNGRSESELSSTGMLLTQRTAAPTDMAQAARLDDMVVPLPRDRWQRARNYLEALP